MEWSIPMKNFCIKIVIFCFVLQQALPISNLLAQAPPGLDPSLDPKTQTISQEEVEEEALQKEKEEESIQAFEPEKSPEESTNWMSSGPLQKATFDSEDVDLTRMDESQIKDVLSDEDIGKDVRRKVMGALNKFRGVNLTGRTIKGEVEEKKDEAAEKIYSNREDVFEVSVNEQIRYFNVQLDLNEKGEVVEVLSAVESSEDFSSKFDRTQQEIVASKPTIQPILERARSIQDEVEQIKSELPVSEEPVEEKRIEVIEPILGAPVLTLPKERIVEESPMVLQPLIMEEEEVRIEPLIRVATPEAKPVISVPLTLAAPQIMLAEVDIVLDPEVVRQKTPQVQQRVIDYVGQLRLPVGAQVLVSSKNGALVATMTQLGTRVALPELESYEFYINEDVTTGEMNVYQVILKDAQGEEVANYRLDNQGQVKEYRENLTLPDGSRQSLFVRMNNGTIQNRQMRLDNLDGKPIFTSVENYDSDGNVFSSTISSMSYAAGGGLSQSLTKTYINGTLIAFEGTDYSFASNAMSRAFKVEYDTTNGEAKKLEIRNFHSPGNVGIESFDIYTFGNGEIYHERRDYPLQNANFTTSVNRQANAVLDDFNQLIRDQNFPSILLRANMVTELSSNEPRSGLRQIASSGFIEIDPDTNTLIERAIVVQEAPIEVAPPLVEEPVLIELPVLIQLPVIGSVEDSERLILEKVQALLQSRNVEQTGAYYNDAIMTDRQSGASIYDSIREYEVNGEKVYLDIKEKRTAAGIVGLDVTKSENQEMAARLIASLRPREYAVAPVIEVPRVVEVPIILEPIVRELPVIGAIEDAEKLILEKVQSLVGNREVTQTGAYHNDAIVMDRETNSSIYRSTREYEVDGNKVYVEVMKKITDKGIVGLDVTKSENQESAANLIASLRPREIEAMPIEVLESVTPEVDPLMEKKEVAEAEIERIKSEIQDVENEAERLLNIGRRLYSDPDRVMKDNHYKRIMSVRASLREGLMRLTEELRMAKGDLRRIGREITERDTGRPIKAIIEEPIVPIAGLEVPAYSDRQVEIEKGLSELLDDRKVRVITDDGEGVEVLLGNDSEKGLLSALEEVRGIERYRDMAGFREAFDGYQDDSVERVEVLSLRHIRELVIRFVRQHGADFIVEGEIDREAFKRKLTRDPLDDKKEKAEAEVERIETAIQEAENEAERILKIGNRLYLDPDKVMKENHYNRVDAVRLNLRTSLVKLNEELRIAKENLSHVEQEIIARDTPKGMPLRAFLLEEPIAQRGIGYQPLTARQAEIERGLDNLIRGRTVRIKTDGGEEVDVDLSYDRGKGLMSALNEAYQSAGLLFGIEGGAQYINLPGVEKSHLEGITYEGGYGALSLREMSSLIMRLVRTHSASIIIDGNIDRDLFKKILMGNMRGRILEVMEAPVARE